MKFLRRLRLFALAWHAARWRVPADITRIITLQPETGTVIVSLGLCCQMARLDVDCLIGLHSDLDDAVETLRRQVAKVHALGSAPFMLNTTRMGTDQ